MGFSSQAGKVVFRTQAAAGTFQSDTLTAGIGMLLRSGSLASNRDLLVTDPEIGGGRDVTAAYLGSISWSGDYEFYVRMESLKTLLAAAFGTAPNPVVTTGVATTTITPSDAASLPLLSIHEEIGAGLESYNYNDAVVNQLVVTADANAYMTGTASIIAKNQVAGATTGPVTETDNTPLTVATNVTVKYNSVDLKAKSFTLTFNNNFEDSDFRLGSFFLGDLTPKRREVTASFTVRETSSALWRQATYGLSTATSPGGKTTPQSLVITAQTYETIQGGTPVTPYGVTFTIPNYILSPYSLSASGDDVIESGIDGQGLRPSAATPICTAVVTAKDAAIA